MTRQWIIKIALVLCALLQLVCSDNVGTGKAELNLTVEDVSCTEVWLQISTRNSIHSKIVLTRDTVTLEPLTLTTNEMTIVDDNLLPSHRYTYTALLLDGGKSAQTIAETMDTTSHDFSFETFLLGDGTGSSCLYDVAIINDTLAYAVGEIYQGGERYNVAKWNGESWQLLQFNYQGAAPEIKTVFAFNENDIWFDPWFHWNGQNIQELLVDPVFIGVGVNKLWGTSSNDLYAIGNNGLIAHYDGKSWSKIESGTTIDIQDIYGSRGEILAVASTVFEIPPRKKVMKIEGTNAITVADDGLPWSLRGIWFTNKTYFIVGDGAYRCRNIGEIWNQISLIQKYKEAIRGQEINDIVIAGHFGLLLHFNGYNWKDYSQQIYISSGSFFSVAVRNNLIVAVGNVGGANAIIAVGRR